MPLYFYFKEYAMKYVFISLVIASIIGVTALFNVDSQQIVNHPYLDTMVWSVILTGVGIDLIRLLHCWVCRREALRLPGCAWQSC